MMDSLKDHNEEWATEIGKRNAVVFKVGSGVLEGAPVGPQQKGESFYFF